jgi:hypothetical protein
MSPDLGMNSGLLEGPRGDGGAGATVGENSFVDKPVTLAVAFFLAFFSLEKQGKQLIFLLFPSYERPTTTHQISPIQILIVLL